MALEDLYDVTYYVEYRNDKYYACWQYALAWPKRIARSRVSGNRDTVYSTYEQALKACQQNAVDYCVRGEWPTEYARQISVTEIPEHATQNGRMPYIYGDTVWAVIRKKKPKGSKAKAK